MAGFTVMVNGWLSFGINHAKPRTRPREPVNVCRGRCGRAARPMPWRHRAGVPDR